MEGVGCRTVLSAALWTEDENENDFVYVKKEEIDDEDLPTNSVAVVPGPPVTEPVFLNLPVPPQPDQSTVSSSHSQFYHDAIIKPESEWLISISDCHTIGASSHSVDPLYTSGKESIYCPNEPVQSDAGNTGGISQSNYSTARIRQSNRSHAGIEQLLVQKSLRLDNIVPSNANKCWLCPYSVHNSASKFNVHLLSVHNIYILHGQCYLVPADLKERLLFTCKFCDYSSFEQAQVNRHMSSLHLWNPEDENMESDAALPTVSKRNTLQKVTNDNDVAPSAVIIDTPMCSRRQLPSRRAKTNISYNQCILANELDKIDSHVDKSGFSDQLDRCSSANNIIEEPGGLCYLCPFSTNNEPSLRQHLISCHKLTLMKESFCPDPASPWLCEFKVFDNLGPTGFVCVDLFQRFQYWVPLTFEARRQCRLCPYKGVVFGDLLPHLIGFHKLKLREGCHLIVDDPSTDAQFTTDEVGSGDHDDKNANSAEVKRSWQLEPITESTQQYRVCNPFACNLCRTFFAKADQLSKHVRNSHINCDPNAYRCAVCEKPFASSWRMQMHANVHLKPEAFSCSKCDKHFRNFNALRLHGLSVHQESKFRCCICLEDYGSRGRYKLYQHLLDHDEESRTCKHCGMKLTNQRALRRHVTDVHNVSYKTCPVCNKTVRRSRYAQHLQTHKSSKKAEFVCSICSKILGSKKGLMLHMCSHTGIKLFPCQFCEKSFATASNRQLHERIHLEVKPCSSRFQYWIPLTLEARRQCRLCPYKAVNSKSLRTHLTGFHNLELREGCHLIVDEPSNDSQLGIDCGSGSEHRNINSNSVDPNQSKTSWQLDPITDSIEQYRVRKPFCCNLCDNSFVKSSQVRKHVRKSHSYQYFTEILYLYKCAVCEKPFTSHSWRDMQQHAHIHLKPETFSCSKCNLHFRQFGAWHRHKLSVHQESNFFCSICLEDYGSQGKYSLYQHLQNHDEANRTCQHCGVIATTQKALRQHVVHTHDVVYKTCAICEKCFTGKQYWKHTQTHKSQILNTAYGCATCNKRCKTKRTLLMHLCAHTGIKPFPCQFCEKSFANVSNRLLHERIHLGNMPYKCRFCGKGFANASNYKQHETTQHKDLAKEQAEDVWQIQAYFGTPTSKKQENKPVRNKKSSTKTDLEQASNSEIYEDCLLQSKPVENRLAATTSIVLFDDVFASSILEEEASE